MELSRRAFLARSTVAGAALWVPALRIGRADAQATCAAPPGFPAGVELYQQAYENWAQEIRVEDVWTCAPRSAGEVLVIADWAAKAGWHLRARGYMHNWAPLGIDPAQTCGGRAVLVDTTQHLTAVDVLSTAPGAVRAQAGASMDALLAATEAKGLGFTAVPAVGEITVGGALAINGHGAGIPARGERRAPGHTYGTLSNLVTSLEVVAWDRRRRRHVLRTLHRSHRDAPAFLTGLGRTFVTETTLRAGADTNLRCVSHVDIPTSELFARDPAPSDRSVARLLDDAGRVEAIWFPFTTRPWVKVWSVSPERPASSREVTGPYNYPFSDNIPVELEDLVNRIVRGAGRLTPLFGRTSLEVTTAGLTATDSADLWGRSKNVLLFIKPSTLRYTETGHTVLTRRRDVQQVVAEFATFYARRLEAYGARDEYPINGPVDIRITGLDVARHAGVRRARPPALSSVRPRADHPEWDVAVWFGALTFPGTPHAGRFCRELEAWMYRNYAGAYATVRTEWSKGWAYTDAGAWTDEAALRGRIPEAMRAGQRRDAGWDWAVRRLDAYDPHRVFASELHDRLMPRAPAPPRRAPRAAADVRPPG